MAETKAHRIAALEAENKALRERDYTDVLRDIDNNFRTIEHEVDKVRNEVRWLEKAKQTNERTETRSRINHRLTLIVKLLQFPQLNSYRVERADTARKKQLRNLEVNVVELKAENTALTDQLFHAEEAANALERALIAERRSYDASSKRVRELEDALEFYADSGTYMMGDFGPDVEAAILSDVGQRARTALGRDNG